MRGSRELEEQLSKACGGCTNIAFEKFEGETWLTYPTYPCLCLFCHEIKSTVISLASISLLHTSSAGDLVNLDALGKNGLGSNWQAEKAGLAASRLEKLLTLCILPSAMMCLSMRY